MFNSMLGYNLYDDLFEEKQRKIGIIHGKFFSKNGYYPDDSFKGVPDECAVQHEFDYDCITCRKKDFKRFLKEEGLEDQGYILHV